MIKCSRTQSYFLYEQRKESPEMEYTPGEDTMKIVEVTIKNLEYYINLVDKAEAHFERTDSNFKRHSTVGSSVQFSSVAQSCPTLCDPMNRSTSGLPVHHQLPEFTQTHVHRVSDAIQPSHPLSSPSPPAPNPSQHQSIFQ